MCNGRPDNRVFVEEIRTRLKLKHKREYLQDSREDDTTEFLFRNGSANYTNNTPIIHILKILKEYELYQK